MEGQIRAISKHMEGHETSDLDPHQGKFQNYLDPMDLYYTFMFQDHPQKLSVYTYHDF